MPCERKHVKAMERIVDRDEQFIDAATTVALRAAISAALDACDEIPWRSMESAPLDEKPVMLACYRRVRPIIGSYDILVHTWRDEDGGIVVPFAWGELPPLPAAPEVGK